MTAVLYFQELGGQILPHLVGPEPPDLHRVPLLRGPLPPTDAFRLRLHGLGAQLIPPYPERRLVPGGPPPLRFSHTRW